MIIWVWFGLGILGLLGSQLMPTIPGLSVLAAMVGLGWAPGYAADLLLYPNERRFWLRSGRAFFLSTILVGGLGLLLHYTQQDVRSLIPWITGGFLAVALVLAVWDQKRNPPSPLSSREKKLVGWLLFLAVVILLPHILRDWVRYRSDAWFHSAVVIELLSRGAPLYDPYFAWLELTYPWFYHSYVSLAAGLGSAPAWNLGGAVNALWLVSLVAGVFHLSRSLGRSDREAFWAAVFVPLGLSSLFWFWLPLKIVRGLAGETGGWEHVRHLFSLTPFTFDQLWHVTSSYGSIPPWLNKFWVMTAFSGALTGAVWWLAGLAEGLGLRKSACGWSRGHVVFFALTVCGTWLLHPAVGVAMTLASGLAGLALLVRPCWLSRKGIFLAALFIAAGTLLALIFVLRTSGQANNTSLIGFDPPSAVAIALSSFGAFCFAFLFWYRRRLQNGGLWFFGFMSGALILVSLVIVLPPPNTADKMSFLFYLPLGVVAGWQLARAELWMRLRWGAIPSRLVLLLLFAPVNVLFASVLFFGEVERSAPTELEREMYSWIRENTLPETVVLDSKDRDDALVFAERRQLWGKENYSTLWGYDQRLMSERRRIRNSIYMPEDPVWFPRAVSMFNNYAIAKRTPMLLIWRRDETKKQVDDVFVQKGFRVVWSKEDLVVFELPVGQIP